MKTLEKFNEGLQKQQEQNRLSIAIAWLGLQLILGKITKKEYKQALKNAKKYQKEIK